MHQNQFRQKCALFWTGHLFAPIDFCRGTSNIHPSIPPCLTMTICPIAFFPICSRWPIKILTFFLNFFFFQVLECVRIRREGFPFRKTFLGFWEMCQHQSIDKCLPVLPPPHATLMEKCKHVLDIALPRNNKGKNTCGLHRPWQVFPNVTYTMLSIANDPIAN